MEKIELQRNPTKPSNPERRSRIKIAFDLDGILIDKPPFIPKRLLEWAFKGGDGSKLHYRFPKTKLEQWIRKLSHFYLFRPPIRKNIEVVRRLAKDKRYELYIISARYSFLKKETEVLFKKWKINNFFKKVFLNLENKQPYIFKAEILETLEPEVFIEDDPLIIRYVLPKIEKTKIFFYYSDPQAAKKLSGVSSVSSLKEIDFSAR